MRPALSPELLRVDRHLGIPVGTQLTWLIRRLIASGRLRPGEQLPGVREVAASASVNVNTARSVYGRLEEQGYLSSEQGRGTFVSEQLPAGGRLERVERLAAELEAGAHAAGLDPHEVAAHLYGPSNRVLEPSSSALDDRRESSRDDPTQVARRELREQIAELEARLVRHPVEPSAGASKPASGYGNALLSSEQLQRVCDDLRNQLDRADARRAELLRELRRLERAEAESGGEQTRTRPRQSASLAGARVRWSSGL